MDSLTIRNTEICAALVTSLRIGGDAETAIAIYKQAGFFIGSLKKIQSEALGIAESNLRETGEVHLKSAIGSCGWTKSRVAQIDKAAWQAAIKDNPALAQVQAEFERAQAALEAAQKPFLVLPEGRFFIR